MTREEIMAVRDSLKVEWWMDEMILRERLRAERNRRFDIGLGGNDIMTDQGRLKELQTLWDKICEEEALEDEDVAERCVDAIMERSAKHEEEFRKKQREFYNAINPQSKEQE